MDYTFPPKVFAPIQLTFVKNSRILQSIHSGRRATLIANRGGNRTYLGADVGVSSLGGFLLRPGDVVAVATSAEVWGTPGHYDVLTLSQ